MAPRKRKADNESAPNTQQKSRTTRSMTTQAARQAVLETTELLEQIILHLPVKKIFVVQRVCKQFYDTIRASPLLQQRMFLKPSLKPQMWKIQMGNGEFLEGGNLPAGVREQELKFVVCTEEETKAAIASKDPNSKAWGRKVFPVKLNPLLVPLDDSVHGRESLPKRSLRSRLLRPKIDLGDAPLNKPQSWRQMLLTDPPLDQAGCFIYWSVKGSLPRRQMALVERKNADHDGLILGNIVDAALDFEVAGYNSNGTRIPFAMRDMMEAKETETGNPGRFSKKDTSHVDFLGVIAPTEDEWEDVTGTESG